MRGKDGQAAAPALGKALFGHCESPVPSLPSISQNSSACHPQHCLFQALLSGLVSSEIVVFTGLPELSTSPSGEGGKQKKYKRRLRSNLPQEDIKNKCK